MPKTKFLSAMKGGIAFFTRIPIKTGEEEFSALTDNTFVFTVIGAIIGLSVGIFSSSISSITFINLIGEREEYKGFKRECHIQDRRSGGPRRYADSRVIFDV